MSYKFDLKTILSSFLEHNVEKEWLDCPSTLPDNLIKKRTIIKNDLIIAMSRWKASRQKKSALLFRLLMTSGTTVQATKIFKAVENRYKRIGGNDFLRAECTEIMKFVKPATSELTPQLKKLRVQTPDHAHGQTYPSTPSRPRPRQTRQKVARRNQITSRTIVRVVRVNHSNQSASSNRTVCRLQQKVKKVRDELKTNRNIARKEIAAEKVNKLQ